MMTRRKKTQPEATRTARAVLIRLTPAELAILDAGATDRGMTRSAYVARLARTGAGIDPRVRCPFELCGPSGPGNREPAFAPCALEKGHTGECRCATRAE